MELKDKFKLLLNLFDSKEGEHFSDTIARVLDSFLPLWKQHIVTMNNMETLLLGELRDALLEPLMTGRIGFENETDND